MNSEDFDELVCRVLDRTSLRWTADMDLRPLATRLGVAEILFEETSVVDGRLEVVGTRLILVLAATRNAPRRRFTLAHEIGHLVLLQPWLRLSKPRREGGWTDDERFCDEFAASLLMPRKWLVRLEAEKPRGLALIQTVAREAGVSIKAVAVRFQRLLGWNPHLIRWQRDRGARWTICDAHHVTPRVQRLMAEAPNIQLSLELARESNGELSEALIRPRTAGAFRTEIISAQRSAVMYLA